MIVKNEVEQWMGCTGCGEQIELSRVTLADAETVLLMMERMREDHTACDQLAHDPRRAAIERDHRKRLRVAHAQQSLRPTGKYRAGKVGYRSALLRGIA